MYKINITKEDTINVRKQTYERIADTGNEKDGKAVYGYVPYDTVEEINVNILTQSVETIDIAKIIKAINNIE